MNERLEHLMYESGLTAQGCWDELDDYAKHSIEKFAELIVRECCVTVLKEGKGEFFDDYARGYNMGLMSAIQAIKEQFGINNELPSNEHQQPN